MILLAGTYRGLYANSMVVTGRAEHRKTEPDIGEC